MASVFRLDLIDMDSTCDDQYLRSGTRTYLVHASGNADEVFVRTNLGYAIYNVHPSDNRQVIKGISVKLRNPLAGIYDNRLNPADPNIGQACLLWTATLSYGPWNPIDHTTSGDPADQPVYARFEGVTYQEAVDLDIHGNPVVNSAGDYFDPPIMRDRTRPVIKIVRNEASFSDSTILMYADKINSDTFYDYPPMTLKCSAPTAGDPLFSQDTGATYYRVNYELHFNADTWQSRPLDQGYRKLVDTAGAYTQQPITASGTPISSPALLNGAGQPIALPASSSDVVILKFDIYQQIAFNSAFNFPPGLLR